MISHDPLSAEDVASILKVSRGSVSTNMRMLTETRLVEKVSLPGERTTFFEFTESALEQTIVARIQSSMIFRKLVDRGLAALTSEDFARHRLERAIVWTDLLIDTFQKALDDWQVQQRSRTEKKIHNTSSKLIEVPYRAAKSLPQKT
jgi:DNA-binding transcriptional regulator GbsR (MarR family)